MSDSEAPPYSQSGPEGSDQSVFPGLVAGPSWQEQDGLLRDLWMQNKTQQEIADILNRSIAAVMTRAARLGLPRRAAPGRKPGSRRPLDTNSGELTANPRRVPRTSVANDGNSSSVQQTSQRICLMCLRSFASQGRHNRICNSCKGSREYESACSTADIHLPA